MAKKAFKITPNVKEGIVDHLLEGQPLSTYSNHSQADHVNGSAVEYS